jgi:predicted RNase H-like HicB family nuclease
MAFMSNKRTHETLDNGYAVVLRQSEEGYSVSCPELHGCFSQGDTREEAIQNIRLAIREYLEALKELGIRQS